MMAVMGENDRAEGTAEYMQMIPPGVAHSNLKAQMRAAFDAADSWADTNAASYNSALPTAFRNAAPAAEKARLLVAVLNRRYHLGL